MAKNRIFSDYEKKTVYARANGKCEICGKPVKFKKMTVDHKIPLSKGGTNDLSNLQLAHLTCNRAKADMLTDEFAELAEQIVMHNRWMKIKNIFAKEIM